MSKKIPIAAMAAVLAFSSAIAPAALADPRHHGGERHYYRDAGRHDHHGRGHYRNGKWIALGILGAAAAAAAADADRDCYYRHGERYCD
jgi:hypothetical protein